MDRMGDQDEAARPDMERESPEQPEEERGPLLDLPDEEAAKLATELWVAQNETLALQAAQWEANALRRRGQRDVHIVKDEDDVQGYRVYTPLVHVGTPAYPNRSDETVSEILSALLVDEPKPDVLPSQDSDEDRDAAEFAGRVLEIETGESGLNLRAKLYAAGDTAATSASGFLWWYTDPYAGGSEPVQVKAHPQATTEQDAATGPAGAEPVGLADYVLRYVREDGTLSSSSAGARRSWRPKVRCEVLPAHNVRFLPYLADAGITGCDGVMIARPTTWSRLVRRYPEVAKLPVEDQAAILGWGLPKDRLLYPDRVRRKKGMVGKDGKPKDDALVLELCVYLSPSPTYPSGCYASFVGGKYRVAAEEWLLEWTDAQGEEHTDQRDLPVAQVMWKPDHTTRTPYGKAVMDDLGPIEELLATFDGGIQQLMFQALNPNVLVPIGSVIQPEAWGRRDGTPIPYNAAVGAPVVEDAPKLPDFLFNRVQDLEARMDRASGSAPSLRGLTSPNVTSGEQEKTIIEQALVMVSNLRHGMEDAYERSCRIILQEFKAHMTAPQMLRYLGEDGGFKYDEWTGADLGSVKDVRVRRGTFTMLAPSAKAGYIDQLVQMQALPLEQANRLKRGAVDWLTGAQDDPHYLRVKRQIRAWKDGPTEEQQAQAQQMAQQQAMQPPPEPQVQGVGPDGQPIMAPPQPPPDPLYQIASGLFAPLPCDDEPLAAKTRMLELSEQMASASFATYPPGWQQALTEAYLRARQASGMQTVAEQQQAAQAQQQAAAQQQQQAEALKGTEGAAKHARDLEKLQVQAAIADDRDGQKLARDMEREQMTAATATG